MAAPNAQDSVLARLVRIIAKHFTPRARSKKSRTDGDQHDGDDGADHDGNGGEGGMAKGKAIVVKLLRMIMKMIPKKKMNQKVLNCKMMTMIRLRMRGLHTSWAEHPAQLPPSIPHGHPVLLYRVL